MNFTLPYFFFLFLFNFCYSIFGNMRNRKPFKIKKINSTRSSFRDNYTTTMSPYSQTKRQRCPISIRRDSSKHHTGYLGSRSPSIRRERSPTRYTNRDRSPTRYTNRDRSPTRYSRDRSPTRYNRDNGIVI